MGERAFSLYDVEQFIREAGAERVTEDAVLDLERELEKLTETLANRAIRYAAHAGRRRLIKKNDVLLVREGRRMPGYMSPYTFSRRARITNAASRMDR